MQEFDGRSFLKLFGQGTAVLGMGMGLSKEARAQTGGSKKTGAGAKDAAGRYQIFQLANIWIGKSV